MSEQEQTIWDIAELSQQDVQNVFALPRVKEIGQVLQPTFEVGEGALRTTAISSGGVASLTAIGLSKMGIISLVGALSVVGFLYFPQTDKTDIASKQEMKQADVTISHHENQDAQNYDQLNLTQSNSLLGNKPNTKSANGLQAIDERKVIDDHLSSAVMNSNTREHLLDVQNQHELRANVSDKNIKVSKTEPMNHNAQIIREGEKTRRQDALAGINIQHTSISIKQKANQLFARGALAFDRAQYERAESIFESYLDAYPEEALVSEARLYLFDISLHRHYSKDIISQGLALLRGVLDKAHRMHVIQEIDKASRRLGRCETIRQQLSMFISAAEMSKIEKCDEKQLNE